MENYENKSSIKLHNNKIQFITTEHATRSRLSKTIPSQGIKQTVNSDWALKQREMLL